MADPKLPDTDMRKIAAAKYKMMKALDGLAPNQQGVVLADLLSMWVAAHFVCDKAGTAQPADTDTFREQLLQFHIRMVRDFLPLSEQELSDAEVKVETLVKGDNVSTRH